MHLGPRPSLLWGHAVHHRMFSSILGIYPLDDSCTPAPSGDNQKCHQALPSVPRGQISLECCSSRLPILKPECAWASPASLLSPPPGFLTQHILGGPDKVCFQQIPGDADGAGQVTTPGEPLHPALGHGLGPPPTTSLCLCVHVGSAVTHLVSELQASVSCWPLSLRPPASVTSEGAPVCPSYSVKVAAPPQPAPAPPSVLTGSWCSFLPRVRVPCTVCGLSPSGPGSWHRPHMGGFSGPLGSQWMQAPDTMSS